MSWSLMIPLEPGHTERGPCFAVCSALLGEKHTVSTASLLSFVFSGFVKKVFIVR